MGNREKRSPMVTVLMSAYNAENYVETAIRSILDQTYDDFEFIIIEDSSKDKTLSIIESIAKEDPRISIFRNNVNLGISKSLNKGLELAKGKYIVKMDADDWSYPDRIEKQVQFMERKPNLSASGGNIDVCDEALRFKKKSNLPIDSNSIMKALLLFNPVLHPTMIYRRDYAEQLGFYNTRMPAADDFMLVMDLSSLGNLANIKDSLIKYRVFNKSFTAAKMRYMHIGTVYCIIKGIVEYGYKINAIVILCILVRLLIAFTIPSGVWRFISSRKI